MILDSTRCTLRVLSAAPSGHNSKASIRHYPSDKEVSAENLIQTLESKGLYEEAKELRDPSKKNSRPWKDRLVSSVN